MRVGGKWKNKKGISMWWGEQHEFRWYVGDCSSINSHARSQIAQAVDTCTCKPTCVSALACRRDSKSKPNPKKQEEEITQTNSTRTPNANHHVPRFRLSKVQHGWTADAVLCWGKSSCFACATAVAWQCTSKERKCVWLRPCSHHTPCRAERKGKGGRCDCSCSTLPQRCTACAKRREDNTSNKHFFVVSHGVK